MFDDVVTIIGQGLGSVPGHRLAWGLYDLVGETHTPPQVEELIIRYHPRYLDNRSYCRGCRNNRGQLSNRIISKH